jgi:hypothetical protein
MTIALARPVDDETSGAAAARAATHRPPRRRSRPKAAFLFGYRVCAVKNRRETMRSEAPEAGSRHLFQSPLAAVVGGERARVRRPREGRRGSPILGGRHHLLAIRPRARAAQYEAGRASAPYRCRASSSPRPGFRRFSGTDRIACLRASTWSEGCKWGLTPITPMPSAHAHALPAPAPFVYARSRFMKGIAAIRASSRCVGVRTLPVPARSRRTR